MPKTKQVESVVHDWVSELPFQQQAVLLTVMRGPDGLRKDHPSKYFIRLLRGLILKPAGVWNGRNDNSFMWGDYETKQNNFFDETEEFKGDHDDVPHHFLMHLIHAAEVVAYRHPSQFVRSKWHFFYSHMCDAMHMTTESIIEMERRLNDFGAGWHNIPNTKNQ